MALLEIQTVNKVTATIALDESIAHRTDQYALFINAPSDEVVSKALEYVFSKDKDFLTFAQTADGKKPEHPFPYSQADGSSGESQARTALDSPGNYSLNSSGNSGDEVVASLSSLGGVETVLRTGSILTLHPSEGRAAVLHEFMKPKQSNQSLSGTMNTHGDGRIHANTQCGGQDVVTQG